MKKCTRVIVDADKTRNLYCMKAENYVKLLRESITQKYEKDTELSQFIWKRKRSNTEFKIKWSIAKKSKKNI